MSDARLAWEWCFRFGLGCQGLALGVGWKWDPREQLGVVFLVLGKTWVRD
jgi:hypothetical protein